MIVVSTIASDQHAPWGCRRRDPYPHNSQEQGSAPKIYSKDNWRISMSSGRSQAAIDQIVASFDGDIHGALKALLLVNEQLEAELQQLYAAVAIGAPFERGSNVLH
jgi:hypothetical protein